MQSDWRSVVLSNVSYDIVLAIIGCSTVAIATSEGPVLARNLYWWPEDLLARATYLIRYDSGQEIRTTTASWPGAIGVVTGMSPRGFAIELNDVLNPEGIHKTGCPVLLHILRVLEYARDFDHALDRLRRIKLAAGGLFTLVGTQNDQSVVIEHSPTKCAVRKVEGQAALMATNDYRQLFATQTS